MSRIEDGTRFVVCFKSLKHIESDVVVWAVNLNNHNFGLVHLEALQRKLDSSSVTRYTWADDIVAGNEALPPPEGGAD